MSNLQVPRKKIVSTLFDDGDGVLVDLDTKRYYQLNESAMMVWTGLERGHDIGEIVSEITSTFSVSPEHAVKSVERILRDFQANNLLQAGR
ncbi:MAG: PqqD family protein [Acidobacteriota bacterium]